MINPPPKTGDVALDGFLRSVYEQSKELEAKAMPEDGWSLTDFTAEVSGVIGDKRDLIDIVTQYDSIEDYLALVDDQKQLLEDALTKVESIEVSADWFAQIMEWWDQNYKIIVDAQESLYYKIEAEESALEAKQHAEKTEQDRVETGQNLTDAREAASDAQTYRQGALTYREGSKEHREASEAAKALSEAAQALAEQFRDGAKAHREAAKVSETNAEASASAASTDANKSAGSASEAAGEVAKAEAAREQVEAVEAALRALMADTEAWQDVSFALESVDSRISTGMEAVKNDILGGVGPAFDTLLELAEALGENADAIGTLTNELAKKADKGHTHVSADITDSVGYMGSSGYANRLVRTGSTGHIHVGTMPSEDNHLSRKGYVDQEVAKKANTSHTHTISETSGLQTALDGKAPESHIHSIGEVDGLEAQLAARAAEGHTHEIDDLPHAIGTTGNTLVSRAASGDFFVNDPNSPDHPANKRYVDKLKENIDGQGASIIPFNSETGRQRWADGLTETIDVEAPTGRYYSNGPGWSQGRNYFFEVDPGVKYYASMWVKADKPGSRMYIEMRDQNNSHAILRNSFSGGTYILGNHELSTEWTLLETQNMEFKPGVHRANINTIYFNHGNGTEQDATQMLTDIQLIPIPKLNSAEITGTDHYADAEVPRGTVLSTGFDGYLHSRTNPTNANHLTRRGYVDDKVKEIVRIGDGEDLNDYRTTGTFIQQKTVGASGGTNYPAGQAGLLRVNDDGGSFTYQEYTTLRGETKYFRGRYSDRWGEWQRVAEKAEVDSELAKKANTSHAHTLADISGVPSNASPSAIGDTIVTRNSSGNFSVAGPTADSHAASKGYVDTEVGKKADSSHKHVSADITDTISYMGSASYGNRIVRANNDGHIHVGTNPTHNNHLARKFYVDARPALFSGAGNPPSTISGATVGDWWLNTTTMELFKITGV